MATPLASAGGPAAAVSEPRRHLTTLQRREGRLGTRLGVSTAWIPRARLARAGVRLLSGFRYERIDDQALHVRVDGVAHISAADTVAVCAGRDSNRKPAVELAPVRSSVHLTAGARESPEVDAVRAIEEGTRIEYDL